MARTKVKTPSAPEPSPQGETLYVRGLPPGTLARLDAYAAELTRASREALRAAGTTGRVTVTRSDVVARILSEALARQPQGGNPG